MSLSSKTARNEAPAPPATRRNVPQRLQIQHSNSEPSLATISIDSNSNTSDRKRKHSESELESFMAEITRKTDKMCNAAEEMKCTIDYMAQKYDELKAQYTDLQNEHREDRKYIKTLEDRLDQFERNSRATCLEIRNVPSGPNETKTSLMDTVISAGKALNVSIQPFEVKDVFRIKTKEPASKTIIVELTSTLLKEKVISMYRKFNKENKLTTEHLKIAGPARQVFISENLTAKMKKLFFQAREYAKANDFKFCWVSHGKIYLRKRENRALVRVQNEADLANIDSGK